MTSETISSRIAYLAKFREIVETPLVSQKTATDQERAVVERVRKEIAHLTRLLASPKHTDVAAWAAEAARYAATEIYL